MATSIDIESIRKFKSLELLATQVVEGFITGLHKSPFHGFSVEFAEHRLYNTGESTRNIDWKLYARTEKLFVKKYEEETNLRCQIVIDTSSSMRFPKASNSAFSKLEYSIYCAASIMQLLRKQRDAVGLSLFDKEINLHTPAKSSPAHHRFLLDQLEQLLPEKQVHKTTSTVEVLHQIAEALPRRSLVVIFSDMLDSNMDNQDELFLALQHLRHNKHELILFHTIDRDKELSFNYENRPYTFEDLETGEQIKLHPNSVRNAYVDAAKTYYKNLKYRCAQYHIDFMKSDVSNGFETDLRSFLIKRSRLY